MSKILLKLFNQYSEEKLYCITHRKEGAWHNAFEKGQNNTIRQNDLVSEYKKRKNGTYQEV